jgi:uncharacterized protein DUF3307
MPWVEVLAAFLACHLVGDYLLQTEWQAVNKRGGLGRNSVRRRALLAHVATYTLAFLPALAVLADDVGPAVLGVAAGIAAPHLVQDDGRLVASYVRKVKRAAPRPGPLMMAVDQTFHVITLFFLALLAGN